MSVIFAGVNQLGRGRRFMWGVWRPTEAGPEEDSVDHFFSVRLFGEGGGVALFL